MDETSSSRALRLLMERICRSSGLQNELINPVGEPVAEVSERYPSQAGARTLSLHAKLRLLDAPTNTTAMCRILHKFCLFSRARRAEAGLDEPCFANLAACRPARP